MNAQVLYFVDRKLDGSVGLLIRYQRTAQGTWAEFMAGGNWIVNDTVLDKVYDGRAEEISEEEAAQIAPMFGGTIGK